MVMTFCSLMLPLAAELGVVICDTLKKVSSLLSLKDEAPTLKLVVVMEPPSEELVKEAAEKGWNWSPSKRL